MSGTVSVARQGRVLVATLANPPHALMDPAIVAGLRDLVVRADADPEVGGVVLTGAHESRFIAHYDVAELLAGARGSPSVSPTVARNSLRTTAALRRLPRADALLQRTPVAGLAEAEAFGELMLSIERCSAVWIAALNGSAQGGGCELALACDFRLMAAGDHGIGQPEILLGFPPGGGGTQRLTRMLGTTRALRLTLDGGPLSPEQAVEIGLVDRVIEGDSLLAEAIAEAERLGSRSKAAIGAVKRSIYEGGSLALADGLRLERAEFMSAIASDEAIEAMAAYVEHLDRTGDLGLYDREAMDQAIERGHFS